MATVDNFSIRFKLDADVEMQELKKNFEKVKKDFEGETINLRYDADEKSIRETAAKARKLLENPVPVQIAVETGSLAKQFNNLDEIAAPGVQKSAKSIGNTFGKTIREGMTNALGKGKLQVLDKNDVSNELRKEFEDVLGESIQRLSMKKAKEAFSKMMSDVTSAGFSEDDYLSIIKYGEALEHLRDTYEKINYAFGKQVLQKDALKGIESGLTSVGEAFLKNGAIEKYKSQIDGMLLQQMQYVVNMFGSVKDAVADGGEKVSAEFDKQIDDLTKKAEELKKKITEVQDQINNGPKDNKVDISYYKEHTDELVKLFEDTFYKISEGKKKFDNSFFNKENITQVKYLHDLYVTLLELPEGSISAISDEVEEGFDELSTAFTKFRGKIYDGEPLYTIIDDSVIDRQKKSLQSLNEELAKTQDEIENLEKGGSSNVGPGGGRGNGSGGETPVRGEFNADEMLSKLQEDLKGKDSSFVNAKFNTDKMLETLREELKSKEPVEVNAKFDAKPKATDESGEVKVDNQVPISIVEDAQNTVDALISKINEKLDKIKKEQTISFKIERDKDFDQSLESLKNDIGLLTGEHAVKFKVTGITEELAKRITSSADAIMKIFHTNSVSIEWNASKYEDFETKLKNLKELLGEVKKGATGKDGVPVDIDTSQIKPTLDKKFDEIKKTPFGIEVGIDTDVRDAIRKKIGTDTFNVSIRPTAPPKTQVTHTTTTEYKQSDNTTKQTTVQQVSGASQGSIPTGTDINQTFNQGTDGLTRFQSGLQKIIESLKTTKEQAEKVAQATNNIRIQPVDDPEQYAATSVNHVLENFNDVIGKKVTAPKREIIAAVEELRNHLDKDGNVIMDEAGTIAAKRFIDAFKAGITGSRALKKDTLESIIPTDISIDFTKLGDLLNNKNALNEVATFVNRTFYAYVQSLEAIRDEFGNVNLAVISNGRSVIDTMQDYVFMLRKIMEEEQVADNFIANIKSLFSSSKNQDTGKNYVQLADYARKSMTKTYDEAKKGNQSLIVEENKTKQELADGLAYLKDQLETVILDADNPLITPEAKQEALTALDEIEAKLKEVQQIEQDYDAQKIPHGNPVSTASVGSIRDAFNNIQVGTPAPPTTPPPSAPVDNGGEDVNPVIPVEIVFSNVKEAYDNLKKEVAGFGAVGVDVELPVDEPFKTFKTGIEAKEAVNLKAKLDVAESYKELLNVVPTYAAVGVRATLKPTDTAFDEIITETKNHEAIPIAVKAVGTEELEKIKKLLTEIPQKVDSLQRAFETVKGATDKELNSYVKYITELDRIIIKFDEDIKSVKGKIRDFNKNGQGAEVPKKLVELKFDTTEALKKLRYELIHSEIKPTVKVFTEVDKTSIDEVVSNINNLVHSLDNIRIGGALNLDFKSKAQDADYLRAKLKDLVGELQRTGDNDAFAKALDSTFNTKELENIVSGLAQGMKKELIGNLSPSDFAKSMNKAEKVDWISEQVSKDSFVVSGLQNILHILNVQVPEAIANLPKLFDKMKGDFDAAVEKYNNTLQTLEDKIQNISGTELVSPEDVERAIDALGKVLDSGDTNQYIEAIGEISRALNGLGLSSILSSVNGIYETIKDINGVTLSNDNIFNSINDILSKSKELAQLVDALKASREKIMVTADAVKAGFNRHLTDDEQMKYNQERNNAIEEQIKLLVNQAKALDNVTASVLRLTDAEGNLSSAMVTMKEKDADGNVVNSRHYINYKITDQDTFAGEAKDTGMARKSDILKYQKDLMNSFKTYISEYQALQKSMDDIQAKGGAISQVNIDRLQELRESIKATKDVLDWLGDDLSPAVKQGVEKTENDFVLNATRRNTNIKRDNRSMDSVIAEEKAEQEALKKISEEYIAQHKREVAEEVAEEDSYIAEMRRKAEEYRNEIEKQQAEAAKISTAYNKEILDESAKSYERLIGLLERYETVSKRIAKGAALEGDEVERNGLRGQIDALAQQLGDAANPLHNPKEQAKYEKKQEKIDTTVQDLEKQTAATKARTEAIEAASKAQKELNADLERYSTVSKRIAKDEALEGDVYEQKRLSKSLTSQRTALGQSATTAQERKFLSDYDIRREKVDSTVADIEKKTAAQKKEAETREAIANAYKQLNDQLEKYDVISQRIAKGEAQKGDVQEQARLVDWLDKRRSALANPANGLYDEKRLAEYEKKRAKIDADNTELKTQQDAKQAAKETKDQLTAQKKAYDELIAKAKEYKKLYLDIMNDKTEPVAGRQRLDALKDGIDKELETLKKNPKMYNANTEKSVTDIFEDAWQVERDKTYQQGKKETAAKAAKDAKEQEAFIAQLQKSFEAYAKATIKGYDDAEKAAQQYLDAVINLKNAQDRIDLGIDNINLKSVENSLSRVRESVEDSQFVVGNLDQRYVTAQTQKVIDDANKILANYSGPNQSQDRNLDKADLFLRTLISRTQEYFELKRKHDNEPLLSDDEIDRFQYLDKLFQRAINDAEKLKAALSDEDKGLYGSFEATMAKEERRPMYERYSKLGKFVDRETAKGGNRYRVDWMEEIQEEYGKLGMRIAVGTKDAFKTIEEGLEAMDALETKIRTGNKSARFKDVSAADVSTLERQMVQWTDNNTAAADAIEQIKTLLHSLGSVDNREAFDQIKAQFEEIKKKAYEAGNAGLSFGDKLKASMGNLARYLMSFASFYRVIGTIKQGVAIVKEMDKAMTDLKKVVDASNKTFDDFQKQSYKIASTVGVTAQTIVQAASEWGRLGYSLEESAELSKTSAVYVNVGDIDATTATTDLVSVLKAFNMEASESIGIVDTLNNVSNKYAVSAAQLGEILKKSSSSMAVSGDSFENIVAMGAAMNAVVQDASITGSTLKVVGMRLRGVEDELKAAGEDTEGMAQSTSKLRAQIMALTKDTSLGAFDIMRNPNEFLTTYEIIGGIAERWNDIAKIDQAALLELMASVCHNI